VISAGPVKIVALEIEVVQRFGGGSLEREVETQELHEFVDWARRAGVRG
jgi:hypothetical protein